MVDTTSISESLQVQAELTNGAASRWTALVPSNGSSRIYSWALDPDCAFGTHNLQKWLAMIAAGHAYPMRIHWRQNSGALLFETTIWGPEEGAEDGGFAAMVPSAASFDGAEVEHHAVTPAERLVKFIVEKPEAAANAFRTIIEPFMRRSEARDAELIRRASAHSAKAAASAAAAAVEQKLAEMAVAAGYEVDDYGEIVSDEPEPTPEDEERARVDVIAAMYRDEEDDEEDAHEPFEEAHTHDDTHVTVPADHQPLSVASDESHAVEESA